ncbi:hypothetical protein [Streptomyces sp. NPDC006640]|uniref:hypothetical protein n=1 Tax=unclassified Streptomyces TaxID=2593676 RepID=UPI003690BE9E
MLGITPEELRQRKAQGRELAEQAAALLNQIEALGLGGTNGQVFLPEIGYLRKRPEGWVLSSR